MGESSNWLSQGAIVRALDPIPDPQGRNPKENRPFVVISSPAILEDDTEDSFEAVAISGSIWEVNTVELPHSNSSQRCYTGLTKQSAAMCNWKVRLKKSRVKDDGGTLKPHQIIAILRQCAATEVCWP